MTRVRGDSSDIFLQALYSLNICIPHVMKSKQEVDIVLPDLLALSNIIQRKEDICVFPNSIIGEAL